MILKAVRSPALGAVLSPGTCVWPAGGMMQARYRGTRVRYMGNLLDYEDPPGSPDIAFARDLE